MNCERSWAGIRQYDLTASLRRFLNEKTDIKTDLIFDGYEYPSIRPLITIEQSQDNYAYRIKRREAVDVIYRWQVGLHAGNLSERMRKQGEISDLLIFNEIPYYDFEKSAEEPAGFFSVEIMAAVPMPNDDIAKKSKRHTTYFDVELNTYKRRG